MEQNDFYQPTEADKELTSFVVDHCNRWRDWRDTNYLTLWEEYERIFRGEWASEDKTRDSERSRIVTPAAQQAVETRHAEIMEAIFDAVGQVIPRPLVVLYRFRAPCPVIRVVGWAVTRLCCHFLAAQPF